MSRIYLFVLSFILGIAIQFGDCKNKAIYEDEIDCTKSPPGSNKTRLSYLEKIIEVALKEVKELDPSLFSMDKEITKDNLGNIINKKDNVKQGSFSDILEKISKYFIFPGTHWCGPGNNAKNENDLGFFNNTDACCRAHDNCKNDILAGETKVNLQNNGIFTRSACSCDHEFYNCLMKVFSPISIKIGITYFNLLKPQCYKCICPTDNCLPDDYNADCNNHCAEYKWTDNPKF